MTSGDARGAHEGANTTARCVRRVLEGMAGTAVRHRVPTWWSKAAARFRNAQRGNAGGDAGNALRKLHEKTSGPSPRRTVAVPAQRPALEGQVTTATPFAPRGSWPRSATGVASRQPTNHSVNALACKAREIGTDCGWQTTQRDALLMPFNFPTVTNREAARGVDRGKCGLRFLPGFWERDGREPRRATCLAECALDRPLSGATVVRHAGLPAGLWQRSRSRL